MSDKAPQNFELRLAGRAHRVEVSEGGLRREISWYVDDELVATTKTSDDKVQLEPGAGLDDAAGDPEHGVLGLRFTMLGRPRRVTRFAPGDDAVARAALGVGGIDLDPEPGSAAARHEEQVRQHPRRYAAQHTAVGEAKVVLPLVLVYLLARFAFSLPLPDWDLPGLPVPDLPSLPWPSIPWPDLPDWHLPGWVREVLDKAKYVWPVLLAWVIARGEINRRRKQDELKAGLRDADAEAGPDVAPDVDK